MSDPKSYAPIITHSRLCSRRLVVAVRDLAVIQVNAAMDNETL